MTSVSKDAEPPELLQLLGSVGAGPAVWTTTCLERLEMWGAGAQAEVPLAWPSTLDVHCGGIGRSPCTLELI